MKKLRIAFLLFVLATVWQTAHLQKQRAHDWSKPLELWLYPINADDTGQSAQYINSLTSEHFDQIQRFFDFYANEYQVPQGIGSVRIKLGQPIAVLPPQRSPGESRLATILWSLKLRWWAWRQTPDNPSAYSQVRLYMLYRQPDNVGLPHSLGLQKGMIGIIHAFADKKQHKHTMVKLVHESLHALGATDKYDLTTGQPLSPLGLASPTQSPLYPQLRAEIMAINIPQSASTFYQAGTLRQCVIGPDTAKEIEW